MKKDSSHARRIRCCILLAAVFLFWLTVFFLPGGAEANWHRIFRFCGLGNFSDCADSASFSLHVLNVGKADSILVECSHHCLLVDGGKSESGGDVVSYLRNRKITTLDYMVNTHPDDDHIGGLKTVAEDFKVKHYFCPWLPQKLIPKTPAYLGTQLALRSKKIAEIHPRAGDSFPLGRAFVLVLGPLQPGDSTNNNSIILKITYGSTSFLLTGDAEKPEEQTLLDSGRNLKADVLKVGHHGSSTSTSLDFLRAVQPKYAAISVGSDSNNLPKAEVSKRLSDAGTTVYRTDINGTILFLSDGKHITVHTEKS